MNLIDITEKKWMQIKNELMWLSQKASNNVKTQRNQRILCSSGHLWRVGGQHEYCGEKHIEIRAI